MTDKQLKDKKIKVKGGAGYVQVKDRILWLDENKRGEYSIDTNYKYFPEQRMWVVKAVLTVDGQTYSGLAQEVESDDYKQVNHTSALENCETSAIGRACAAYGIGIEESYASQNEVDKAQYQAKAATEKQIKTIYDTVARLTGMDNKEDMDKWLEEKTGATPDKLSVKAAGTVITKLFAAEKARKAEPVKPEIEDEVITDLPDKIDLDKVPY